MTDQPQEAERSAGGEIGNAPRLAIARVAQKQARGDYDMVPVTFLVDGEEIDEQVWFGGVEKLVSPRNKWHERVGYQIVRAGKRAIQAKGKSAPFSFDPTNSGQVFKAFGV